MKFKFNFKFVRELPIIVALSVLFGIAFSGLIIAPVLSTDLAQPTANLVAYSPTETRGREIYVREGCVYCHSQQVRKVKADDNMRLAYGASQSGDYYYDLPHLLGTSRQGPDLSNEGQIWGKASGEYAREYLIGHFKNPREYNPQSIMPALSGAEKSGESFYHWISITWNCEEGAESWVV